MKKTVFALLCLMLSLFLGCSKDDKNNPPPTPQTTYTLVLEFADTPIRSPEGYLYAEASFTPTYPYPYDSNAGNVYEIKGTVFDDKGNIITGSTITWSWQPIHTEINQFHNFSSQIPRRTMSGSYLDIF